MTDDRGATDLHIAAENNQVDLLESLLTGGADIDVEDRRGLTPLFYAACSGSKEAVVYLVEKGARIEQPNTRSQQWSIVGHAAKNNQHEIVKLLIEKGALIDGSNESGYTMLHYAACGGAYECAVIAIDQGIDVNCKNLINQTPLHLAAALNHPAVVRLLLEHGADPHIRSDIEARPFAISGAKERNHREVIKILEEFGREHKPQQTGTGG